MFTKQDDPNVGLAPGQPADVPFTLATGPESEDDT